MIDFLNTHLTQIEGLLSFSHLLYIIFGIGIFTILMIISYKKDLEAIKKEIRIIGIIMIALEILKIVLNSLIYKDVIENVLPLYYSSLLLYLYIPTFFKNKKISDAGFSLIKYYGLIPGLAYTFIPVTALEFHPFLSFHVFHSMTYHVVMAFCSIILLIKDNRRMTKNEFILYAIVTSSFSLIDYIINIFAGTNFMYISYPGDNNEILQLLYKLTKWSYPLFVGGLQCFGSLLFSYLASYFLSNKVKKASKNAEIKS